MTERKRTGGRAARRKERGGGAGSGPTAAIWPGIEGGSYAPLTDAEIKMIDQTACRILEEVGLKGATKTCIETVCASGGTLTEDGRLLMPEVMVRAVLKTVGRGFKLCGLDPVHDIDPSGARTHFGTSGGSAEQGLLMAACAQMARYYRIPCAVSAGMTDSKLPDFQAGYEKAYTELLASLAGANLIYEAAGMYGSLLGASLESFVLDNDLIGSVMRSTRGFEVTEETLSLETIRDVCVEGPGHFLGHNQTINRMESDYFYPAMADRRTPQEWCVSTDKDLLERARIRTQELLSNPHPSHIPEELDKEIQQRFPLRQLGAGKNARTKYAGGVR